MPFLCIGEQDLVKAREVAKAADVQFNPGSWMTPCSIELPDNPEEAVIVKELLAEQGVAYTESYSDPAR